MVKAAHPLVLTETPAASPTKQAELLKDHTLAVAAHAAAAQAVWFATPGTSHECQSASGGAVSMQVRS